VQSDSRIRSDLEKLFTEPNFQILRAVEEVSGRLGKSPSQVAIAWLLAMPGVTSTIIGARNMLQLDENLGAGDWVFPPAEWKKLDDASALPIEYPQDFQAWVDPLIHGELGGH
jgi:aryl-alcohol dehydrogenase-like predicted oxidoreductase